MSSPHFKIPLLGLLIATFGLLGCTATRDVQRPEAAAANPSPTSLAAAATFWRQDGYQGLYEIVGDFSHNELFVAASPSFDERSSGLIYRLDPVSLSAVQTIQLLERPFALALDARTRTLYAGLTLDGSLAELDADSGQVKRILKLAQPERDADGVLATPHTRKVVVDAANGLIFISSPGERGRVWIVDAKTFTLKHQVMTGLWTAGLAYDAASGLLYASQGGRDELVAIDPRTGQIVKRYSTGDTHSDEPKASRHFLLNMALDAQARRLYLTDSNTNAILTFDLASGRFGAPIATGVKGLLDIKVLPATGRLVATYRGSGHGETQGSGGVLVYDLASQRLLRNVPLPVHPNSLAVAPDEKTLYLTVKAPLDRKHELWRENGSDGVVRLGL